jgi:hypothetical protein
MSNSFNLILNNNNVVKVNGFYNQLKYTFINGSFKVNENMKLQLVSAQIPYSFFNISSILNNNTFIIQWPKGIAYVNYTVIIPDGFYSYSDLSNYINFYCKTNGLYLLDNNSIVQNFISIQSNTTYYSVQLNLSAVPASLPANWSNPANLQFPTTPKTPIIEILNNKFSEFLGYLPGIYPPTTQSTSYMTLSNITPKSSSTNSIIFRCNLINNNISIPGDVLDSIGIFNTPFGNNINYASTLNDKKTSMRTGTYNEMTILLTNENNEPLQNRDPNLLLNLLITTTNN